jgi:hypothetical protein
VQDVALEKGERLGGDGLGGAAKVGAFRGVDAGYAD